MNREECINCSLIERSAKLVVKLRHVIHKLHNSEHNSKIKWGECPWPICKEVKELIDK